MTPILIGSITLVDATLTFHPGADFHTADQKTQQEVFSALTDFFANLANKAAPQDATQVSSDADAVQ